MEPCTAIVPAAPPPPALELPADTPRVERLLHAMDKAQLVEMLGDIFFTLYPGDDPTAEWEASTIEDVAQVFLDRGLVLDENAYGEPAVHVLEPGETIEELDALDDEEEEDLDDEVAR